MWIDCVSERRTKSFQRIRIFPDGEKRRRELKTSSELEPRSRTGTLEILWLCRHSREYSHVLDKRADPSLFSGAESAEKCGRYSNLCIQVLCDAGGCFAEQTHGFLKRSARTQLRQPNLHAPSRIARSNADSLVSDGEVVGVRVWLQQAHEHDTAFLQRGLERDFFLFFAAPFQKRFLHEEIFT